MVIWHHFHGRFARMHPDTSQASQTHLVGVCSRGTHWRWYYTWLSVHFGIQDITYPSSLTARLPALDCLEFKSTPQYFSTILNKFRCVASFSVLLPSLIHSTVLKLHVCGQIFAQIGGCTIFFSQPEAGLTNRVPVQDSRAGAPLLPHWTWLGLRRGRTQWSHVRNSLVFWTSRLLF